MFCVACKQPYNWDTQEMRETNTNPEYIAWVERTRAARGAKTASHDLALVFSAAARGDDGLTSSERNGILMAMLGDLNITTGVSILAVASCIETRLIQKLVGLIPTPADFSAARRAHMLGDISLTAWTEKIEALETLSAFAKATVFLLDECVDKFSEIAKGLHNSVCDMERDNVLDAYNTRAAKVAMEVAALRLAVETQVAVNTRFAALTRCLRVSNGESLRRFTRLFPNARAFLDALSRRGRRGAGAGGASMRAGGDTFECGETRELQRQLRIMSVAGIDSVCVAATNLDREQIYALVGRAQ